MEISKQKGKRIMADDNFKVMLFAFVLFALFGMLILSAVVEVGDNYSMDTSQVVGGSLALDKFNESVTTVETQARLQQTAFSTKSIWSAVAGLVLIGIFPIAQALASMILTPFKIVSEIASNTLGIPSYVTSVVLGLLIISIILAVWRLLKVGD